MQEAGQELIKALIEVQKEAGFASRDGENSHFHSKYPTLESCLLAYLPILSKNGFALSQIYSTTGDKSILRTLLMHESGQVLIGEQELRPAKNDPQGVASATTYARRIGLLAIVGGGSEDDDGEGSMNRTQGAPSFTGTIPPKITQQSFDEATRGQVGTSLKLPGEYVVRFGMYDGKKIKEIPRGKIIEYRTYLLGEAQKKNESLHGFAKEFVDHANEYLKGGNENARR